MSDTNAPDLTEDRGRTRLRWGAACCLFLAILISIPFWNRDKPDVPTEVRRVASTEARPIEVLAEGFTSSSSCQECHPNEHRSWHASYHRTMTQVVNDETAPQAIRDTSVSVEGEHYLFEQQGDQFFVTFRDQLVNGETRRRQLVMMTGSHHMHVFWYESQYKRTPGLLPIVYLKDERRWIPRRSAFLKPPDMPERPEVGRWNETCCKCHSTHPRQRLDPQDRFWDTHVVEFGIACEACHGQGAEHVRHYSSKSKEPASKELAVGDKIINPLTVAHRASADVCGQCHSITMPSFEKISVDDYLAQGNPFEPGQLLAESSLNLVIQASDEHRDKDLLRRWSQNEDVYNAFWPDGMPRASGREYNGLIESPCYQQGKMTCLSCHTMHPEEGRSLDSWRDDQLKPNMRGDQACLQCHAEYSQDITAHTHHAADSHGSRCMNCHMPHTTYGLLKTIRSHQVSSPSVMSSVQTGRPSGCTLCHLDRSFAWIADNLHDWYGQPQLELNEEADSTSAAVLHFLRGDAAQRAIQASAFAWKPAQEASGTEWMAPILLCGMNDPYDAVRIISARTLRTLPGRESFVFDTNATYEERLKVINAAFADIKTNARLEPNPTVLIDPEGIFDFTRAQKLIEQRNHRPMNVQE